MKKIMPKVGSQVTIEAGVVATVRGLNIISETVLLEVEGRDSYLELSVSDINKETPGEQKQNGRGSKSSKKNN
jgi:cell fate regulator YaaT (PSP1 superfamily)